MAGRQSPFKFLGVRPNEATDPDDAFAVRSHVRKVIEAQKRMQPRPEVYHFVQRRPGKTKPRRKRAAGRDNKQRQHSLSHRLESAPSSNVWSSKDGGITDIGPAAYEKLVSSLVPIPRSPVCTHPWAVIAARYVDLAPSRLDSLFKSLALREAAEPIFDPSHVDSPRSITAVFPTCLEDAAFFNALVFSIVLTANRGQHTPELLRLKCRAIQVLNDSIVFGSSSVPLAAVLIFRGAAYKWEGSAANAVHANGLSKLLDVSPSSLTPATLRAI
jgi:hypothetical protein